MILVQNILFLKPFLACNGCLRHLPKLKEDLGLAFDAFPEKFSLLNTLSIEKVQ